MINTNLPPILHRFGKTAFQMSKIAILATSLAFNIPRRKGSPGTISVNFPWMTMDGQGTKRRRKIAENFNRLSRAHEGYRQTDRQRQTDRRNGDSI